MAGKTSCRPVVLCVLDGWGHRPETEHNAIALAETPVWDRLTAARPYGLLATSGTATWACRRARWATPRSAT